MPRTTIQVYGTMPQGGTSDYEDLDNKPKINDVELSGNKSLQDLGIIIPTKTGDLENNSNFIASTVITAFWKGTQEEYDLIEEKSETTLYIIAEAEEQEEEEEE